MKIDKITSNLQHVKFKHKPKIINSENLSKNKTEILNHDKLKNATNKLKTFVEKAFNILIQILDNF